MNGALAKGSPFWSSLGSFAKQRSKPGAFTKQVAKVDGKIITRLSERSLFSFSSISSNRGSHCEEERGKEDKKKKKKYKKKNTNENNGVGVGEAICLGESKWVQYKVAYLTLATKRERLARERSLCYDPLSPPPSPSFPSFLFFLLHNQGSCNLHGSSPGNIGFGPHLPTYKDTWERCLYSYMCPTDH